LSPRGACFENLAWKSFALAGSPGEGALAPQVLMSKLKWHSISPYIGGRVVAVTGVPGNANLFYAGAVGGGVWRSTDVAFLFCSATRLLAIITMPV